MEREHPWGLCFVFQKNKTEPAAWSAIKDDVMKDDVIEDKYATVKDWMSSAELPPVHKW